MAETQKNDVTGHEEVEDQYIKLTVIGQGNDILVHEKKYLMSKKTPLKVLKAAFCIQTGIKSENVRLVYMGWIIKDNETPEMLNLENDDTIQAVHGQVDENNFFTPGFI